MALKVKIPNGPTYMDMEGFRLTSSFSLELFQSALKYQPEDNDVFVVSFPKAGTTWLQQIGYLLFHEGSPPSSPEDFHSNGPFLELSGANAAKGRMRGGFIKSHFPYNLMPQNSSAKYIYICRNPKDTCVSLFYQTRRFPSYEFEDGKFEDFFEVFLSGSTDFGDYFDHVLSWYERRHEPNVLLVHYEDAKSNLKDVVLKIAKFLGEEHYRLLLQDQNMLERVLVYSGIDYMKEDAANVFENLYPTQATRPYTRFIRKGQIGDWRKHFVDKMNARIEDKIYRKLSNTDLIREWKKHSVM
ncbi:sulfotransferase 1C4 [Ixodes scapularis]|uniref:sulfotransferase 1C4 n=1 Tax=Ixodes scapularis TaxID=6945 RepID=UPI001A9D4920|nr:sulfotransferase 1C4 [Ixodes scapularis]